MKRLGVVVAILLALSLSLAAASPSKKADRNQKAPAADGVMLYLDVDGERLRVELQDGPKMVTMEDGEQIVSWTLRDAATIEDAFVRAGKADVVPDILGNLRAEDANVECLSLDIEGCSKVNGTIPGHIRYDSEGHPRWSVGQLRAIRRMLAEAHCSDAFLDVFNLVREETHEVMASFSDGPTPILADTPLSPACGACSNGKECIINSSFDCCTTGGRLCSKCKVCSGTRAQY